MAVWGKQFSSGDQTLVSRQAFWRSGFRTCQSCRIGPIQEAQEGAGCRMNGDGYGTTVFTCLNCNWNTSFQYDDASEDCYYYEARNWSRRPEPAAVVKPEPPASEPDKPELLKTTETVTPEALPVVPNALEKWNRFYEEANLTGKVPPWESAEAFIGLRKIATSFPEVFSKEKSCIELGCGCSASSVFLSTLMNDCVAVDLSPIAIERAKLMFPESNVNWKVGDLFDDTFINTLGTFDILFDMQCFHVLRDIDELKIARNVFNLLKPNGYCIIVSGAYSDDEIGLEPGPPRLKQEELIKPFINQGMEQITIELTRFNSTPYYQTLPEPPLCWVAMFRKPNAKAAAEE